MSLLTTIEINKITPIKDHILVTDMQFNERLSNGGIILPGDDTKSQGIRPRWGKVFAVGPKQKDIKVNEYVLVKHGRWTRGVKINISNEDIVIRRVDNEDILCISDTYHEDETQTTAHVTNSDLNRIEGSMHNHDGNIRNM